MLVGKNLGAGAKWRGPMTGVNESIYGIPKEAPKVVKFNTVINPSLASDLTSMDLTSAKGAGGVETP